MWHFLGIMGISRRERERGVAKGKARKFISGNSFFIPPLRAKQAAYE
jgi:hypothetical protein